MKTIIAGNWKMNKTLPEVKEYVEAINQASVNNDCEVKLFVPSIFVSEVKNTITNPSVSVGTQNIHQEESGAFTGEVAANMVKSIGVNATLVGHSERRSYYNETDSIVNKKVKEALKNGLSVMLCVGETLEERKSGMMKSVISTQLRDGLAGISEEEMKNIQIAYEPVWAIGTGETATSEQAQEACLEVRNILADIFTQSVADQTPILYGGSVNNSNVEEILSQNDINGVLVGGACLDANGFSKMFK